MYFTSEYECFGMIVYLMIFPKIILVKYVVFLNLMCISTVQQSV